MTQTLQQLKESVDRLIEQQGADAPVASWIFTNDDVFVDEEDGQPECVSREIAETVLNKDHYDHIFTEIFDSIQYELNQLVEANFLAVH